LIPMKEKCANANTEDAMSWPSMLKKYTGNRFALEYSDGVVKSVEL